MTIDQLKEQIQTNAELQDKIFNKIQDMEANKVNDYGSNLLLILLLV